METNLVNVTMTQYQILTEHLTKTTNFFFFWDRFNLDL